MQFSVIYSVDVSRDTSIRRYVPKGRAWECTEGDEQYDYGYLEGSWRKGKHRKLCAILTRKQFDSFVDQQGLFAEDIETLGSLGAPGFGVGLSPAISFRSDDQDAIQSAYVTPIPRVTRKKGWTDRDWQRIRSVIIDKYN